MKGKSLVSIVTPSYNQGRFLEETIKSVLAQDYTPIEYLIIDGGSEDNSLDIIRRYEERLAFWESEPDRGQAHAINKGLKRARGDILGWLNSDDVLLPNTISRVVNVLENNLEIDAVYGRLERINSQGILVPTPLLPKDKVTFNKSLVVGECAVNQPGCFWRRSIMDKAGFLNEELIYNLDYEYWIRLALSGAKFFRLPEVLARFRLSQDSKTVSQADKMAVEQLSVLHSLLETEDLAIILGISDDQLRDQAKKTYALIQLHAFYGSLKRGRWQNAFRWFARALQTDPVVIFQRRWLDLLITGAKRRLNSF